MANTKHAVVRIDEMAGTKNPTFLKSVMYYSSSEPAEIDNAQVVALGDKLDREVYKATAPAAGTARDALYLIAGVELFYDQTITHYLTEWVNEAGKPVRAYQLVTGGTFSATAEAFNKTPSVNKYVGYTADATKLAVQDAADATTFGKIVHTETVGYGDGQYTYYMVDLIPATAGD